MHLVKMTMKWPSSMISRGPKMFRYKIHWKLTVFLTDRVDFVPFPEVGSGHLKAEGYIIVDAFEHQTEDPREVAESRGWTAFSAAGGSFNLS